MIEMYKVALGIAAGIAGAVFIGYCIYFDKKRRSDPQYKKKVNERRRRNRQMADTDETGNVENTHENIERYFLQELQLGKTLIAGGDIDNGVEHLANAIVVCADPDRILEMLQIALPTDVFDSLIEKLDQYFNEIYANNNEAVSADSSMTAIQEDTDVQADAESVEDVE